MKLANVKQALISTLVVASLAATTAAHAATYKIDSEGQHAFIQFKVNHLGFSYVLGEFRDFTGEFEYDPENPNAAKISVDIDTTSVDSTHAERDKHLRSDDFLQVEKHKMATFVSTSYSENEDGTGVMKGDLTLLGTTKNIEIETNKIGLGDDPWGGQRAGFEGTTRFTMKDFGITKDLGPKSQDVELYLVVEGIKQ